MFEPMRGDHIIREIVFLISDVGQFDIHFKAFVRETKEED